MTRWGEESPPSEEPTGSPCQPDGPLPEGASSSPFLWPMPLMPQRPPSVVPHPSSRRTLRPLLIMVCGLSADFLELAP